VLGADRALLFALRRQEFVEIIRAGEWLRAVAFAREHLAPIAAADPRLLGALEAAMALVATAVGAEPSAASGSKEPADAATADPGDPEGLLRTERRAELADAANAAVLAAEGRAATTQVAEVVSAAAWLEARVAATRAARRS
jgi:hypothetical protein